MESILEGSKAEPSERLLVGNSSRDDAAAFDLGNGQALISTTDFFMPIVDDAHTFGRVAAANALSDVYAMGGTPVLALGILGWPVEKIPFTAAREVILGGRSLCAEAGVVLGGGHSIDNPEPVFGLSVNGLVSVENLKRNTTGQAGDYLYLTKGLGVGLLTTAEKKGLLLDDHQGVAAKVMSQLNDVGEELGKLAEVSAMTDVTGFGLGGHLLELCQGSGVRAELSFDSLPLVADLHHYFENKSWPGGTARNFNSYGAHLSQMSEIQKVVICDPQTSGGLLISVSPAGRDRVETLLDKRSLPSIPIGRLEQAESDRPTVTVLLNGSTSRQKTRHGWP